MEEDRKINSNIKEIETNIPTTKTPSFEQYCLHVQYMCTRMAVLHSFYNFRTIVTDRKNYRGRQIALDNTANILTNGSKKFAIPVEGIIYESSKLLTTKLSIKDVNKAKNIFSISRAIWSGDGRPVENQRQECQQQQQQQQHQQ
ncbi:MAG: hypothetical protein EXX96DRAFT_648920 [Benjaminiella poitrasii]|nr:MAG: hypothetical protein EXX96DRAFT_648920 [Benjaminiella poitrasii]